MKTPDWKPWPIGAAPDASLCGEGDRAQVLARYGLDSLEDDPELERISRFAASLCKAPIAMVTVVEEERQRFLAREGLEERETPRPTSFCAHAMLGREPLEIGDATKDPRFSDNPLVTGHPHIRFYAGAPLVSTEGAPIGALCIIDHTPRPGGLTDVQRDGLEVMAHAVMRRLMSRRMDLFIERDRQIAREQVEGLANMMPDLAWTAPHRGRVDFLNQRYIDFLGRDTDDPLSFTHGEDEARVRKKWREAWDAGEAYEDEFRYRRHDGNHRWMLARALPVKTPDGEISRWFGTLTDIDDGHRRAEAREIMAQELSHRIKNIFAVVSGLVMLAARKQPEHKDFADDISGKIRALGRAHDFVRPDGRVETATLHGLLTGLFEPYSGDGEARVTIAGDDLTVDARAATPLALVFHELATNSAKYGRLSADAGDIAVTIAEQDGAVLIHWREDDVEQPDSEGEGFGSRLLKMSVEGQLRGLIERRWQDGGLTVELTVPVDAISG